MAANYVLLGEITASTNVASVVFSNIPQTGYTDLVVKGSVRTEAGTTYGVVYCQFNSAVYANQTYKRMFGDGLGAGSDSGTAMPLALVSGNGATANTFGTFEVYFPNYTSNNAKSVSCDSVGETNATTIYSQMLAGLWNPATQAPITSLTFAGSIMANSTFYLYGVAALGTTPVIAPKATGGDIIANDGTYWYHAFLSSGTFTPAKALSCDYLVVAGGGGGGANAGGGGGAGGLRSTVTATGGGGSLESKLSLGTSAYTVTIGAGGTRGSTNGSTTPTNGSNSVFSTISSTGGGYGANPNASGIAGGSGGGAAGSGSITGGAGTANQGFAGGASSFANVAGGGGGAGAVGTASLATISGNGGAGVAVAITGSSVTYAGGGGGGLESTGTAGTGGAGGGGNGSGSNGNGVAGTSNTGGGGGGGSNGGAVFGGNGGSGIVIVRYLIA